MDREAEEIKRQIKKADIVLIMVCFLAAIVLAGSLLIGRKEGHVLRISYDGETIMTVKLKGSVREDGESVRFSESDGKGVYYLITYGEDGAVPVKYEERPEVPADGSYNLIYLSDKEVQMAAADCRDQICVHHKPITGGKESIICLPHRLVVEFMGEAQDGMDGMVK